MEEPQHYQFEANDEPRPALVTLVCWVGWLFILIFLFSELVSTYFIQILIAGYGYHFPLVISCVSVLAFIALIGVWRMHFWGPVLYGLTYIGTSIYTFWAGIDEWWVYLPGLIALVILLFYIREMDLKA